MSHSKKYVLLVLMIGAGLQAAAQRAHSSGGDTTTRQAISEVVITGQYRAGRADAAVQQIRVIGRKQIDAMAAQNLHDVLTNEPNIRLSQDNILGSSMSLQGISGQSIKYLIDGVPVIGRQDGDIDLAQINLNNIERIEIIKGPMSVSYGNNALGGTINLITKKTQEDPLEVALNAYYEGIGTYNVNGRVGVQQGNHLLSFSGGRNYFDGWNNGDAITFDHSALPADNKRFQEWKPREQYFGDGQYSYRMKATTFTYRAGLFKEEIINRGLPRMPYGEAASDDHYKTQRFDNALFINSTAWKGKNINFQIAYNQYKRIKNTYSRDLTNLGSGLSQNPGDQDTSRFKLFNSRTTLSGTASSELSYEAGYDINAESATGVRIKDTKQQIADYAVFISAEYKPLNGLTIRPGFRYAYNTRYNAPVTPAINIRYAVGDHLTFRASYTKGFRAPDLKELYFYFVDVNHNIKGNEKLQSETSDNYSASIVYTGASGDVSYRFEGNGYYNNIRNKITLAMITGTEYSYVNVGKYLTHGGELNGSLSWKGLTVSVGGTYGGTYNELHETDAAAVSKYSYSPELRSSVMYSWKRTGVSIALFYKYTGRQPGFAMPDSVVLPTYTASYNTADLSVSKFLFKNQIRITAGVKNLFDVTDVNAFSQGDAHSSGGTSVPMSTGRNYFLKLDFNFHSKL